MSWHDFIKVTGVLVNELSSLVIESNLDGMSFGRGRACPRRFPGCHHTKLLRPLTLRDEFSKVIWLYNLLEFTHSFRSREHPRQRNKFRHRLVYYRLKGKESTYTTMSATSAMPAHASWAISIWPSCRTLGRPPSADAAAEPTFSSRIFAGGLACRSKDGSARGGAREASVSLVFSSPARTRYEDMKGCCSVSM